jgi:hypothetical protein
MTPEVVTAAATEMVTTIAITMIPYDPMGHHATQEHQGMEEIILHPAPPGDEAVVEEEEEEVGAEAIVDHRDTVTETPPHQETIEALAVGFQCHPRPPLEETPLVYTRQPKITEVRCTNDYTS